MKHLLPIVFVLLLSVQLQAQDGTFPLKAGSVHYELVDSSFKNMPKSRLYIVSKLWLLNQLNGVKNFVEVDSPEEGLIGGRIALPVEYRLPGSAPFQVSFSFMIVAKDGRFRAQFYHFQASNYIGEVLQTYPLEQFLEPILKKLDTKKALPKLEGDVYALMRSIQHEMELVYTLSDF